jgi:hypothetical protein
MPHRQRSICRSLRRSVCSVRGGRGEPRDARGAHGGGLPRVAQRLIRRVQEVQRQRRLVVRLRDAPVVRLNRSGPRQTGN